MKRFFTVCILMALVYMFAAGTAFAQDESMSGDGMQSTKAAPVDYKAARNQFAFSLGVYQPAKDDKASSDDDWENGGDLTATYTRLFGNHFAVEAGMHAYATNYDKHHVEGERSHSGVEILALYVPIHGRIMPYIGGGLGQYFNHIKVKVYGNKIIDDDGSATGVVIKGGLRAHITQRFFIGGFIKGWTNNQVVEFENGHKDALAYGGSSINFEAGIAF